jgi:uncharacterized protein
MSSRLTKTVNALKFIVSSEYVHFGVGYACFQPQFEVYLLILCYFREEMPFMECRTGCGACCIAPSISSPIPGMPDGKPAGVRCIQLTSDNKCSIFGKPERPRVCTSLKPSRELCRETSEEALSYLLYLEEATATGPK